MQNKGIVKFIAVLLTLVCLFYLSFGFVTRHYDDKAAAMSKADATAYLDSMNNERVYLGTYTLRQCREMQIGLGLDLKGGMNVILEVSVPDVIEILADHKSDPAFVKAMSQARLEADQSQSDFITLFIRDYKQLAPNSRLAEIFATQKMKGKVSTQSTDKEVEKALREEVNAAVDNSYNVVRNRIDKFGVVQPNIQRLEGQTGRIMVEMPGIREPERIRKLLQGSANLEFWETYNSQEITPFINQLDSKLAGTADTTSTDTAATAKKQEAKTASKAAKTNFAAQLKGNGGAKKKAEVPEASAQMKKQHPLLAIFQPTQGAAGCVVGYANVRDTAEVNRIIQSQNAKQIFPSDLSLKWGVKAADFDTKAQVFELYAIKITGKNGQAPLQGDVVTDAKDEFDQFSRPCVSMSMNSEGARLWAQLTKANINKAIAIVLDGYVYSAPNVNSEITGGNSQITGNFTIEDTKDLANTLKSGKMPAPARIVQEEVVGPSLGAESIQQGIISFIIAFVLLIFYMCAMYDVIPGLIADGALLANMFFTLGILTSFQAALTMPGIAGMVLSLGTAVDANVLIYERCKEELRAGKNVKQAIGEGYKHAFSAIFDSNLTSFITGVILYYFGTGPIRGFATTWIIGIIISFFTAVYCTRLVWEHQLKKDKWLNQNFVTRISRNMMQNTHFQFMGMYHKSFTVVGIALVIFIASFALRGLSQSIDFTGGRNYVLAFEKPVQPEQVRTALANTFKGSTVSAIAIGTDNKTMRISTNYKIESSNASIDDEIEEMLFKSLTTSGMLTQKNFEAFKNPDIREGGSIISSTKVGPSVAKDITYGAIISVFLALIAIFLYILLRFRNVAFSVGSIVALTIDTVAVVGIYSLCWGWMPFSLEIDQTFIGAILTVIGYSINDKVVVFDRIREYFHLYPKHDRQTLFNDSINATLGRTVNTSVSTLIVLVCILFLGGDSIRSFAFAMTIGVVFGTLSSIFIAAPAAYLTMGARIRREEKKELAQEAAVEATATEVK
jgi:SecD/SecF fusion protein